MKLDGTGVERLTDGKGTHQITMSPKAAAYLDRYASMTKPDGTTFHDVASGRTKTFHEPASLEDYDLVTPEWTLLDTRVGAIVGLLLM